MQLTAVTLARVAAFIETFDLNPRGRVHFPDLVAGLVETYGFLKYPQKFEDFDETKGVLFDGGKAGDISGLRFQVFTNLIVAESGSSTDESERILEEVFLWMAKKFGLNYAPGMIKRKAYVSQLTFHSEVALNALHPALAKLSDRVTNLIPKFIGQSLKYETTTFSLSYDLLTSKLAIAPFTIERRTDTPFSENKYFSTAPLPTDKHITLLKEFEADLLAPR